MRDQITELGGTRAVAERLGRSERTVRRWAQQERVPPAAADPFTAAVQRNQDTDEYRRRQIHEGRDAEMRQRGARLKFQGVAGPVIESSPAIKRRSIDHQLSPTAMASILDAFYAEGPAAALDALSEAMATEYMGNPETQWQFRGDQTALLSFLYNR